MTKTELIAYLEKELICDQNSLNKTLLEPVSESDKYLASFYEGCCSTLRSVILSVQDLED